MTDRTQSKRPAKPGNGRAKLSVDQWAQAINTEWRKGVPAIVRTGQLLNEAQKALGHGNWTKMVGESDLIPGLLDFQLRIAQMLQRIAKNPTLSKASNFSLLPPVYTTLYRLTSIPPDKLQAMIDDGEVHPRLRGAEAKTLAADHVLFEDFGRPLLQLANLLARLPADVDAISDDTLGRLDSSVSWKFDGHGAGRGAGRIRATLVPRLDALLARLEQLAIDRDYEGTGITERGGKRCFREDRAIADPHAD